MLKLNKKPVVYTSFPNGEVMLPIQEINDIIQSFNEITFIFNTNEDLIKLAILKGYLDEMKCQAKLDIRYMPYSRMDRPNGYYSMSIKPICDLINNLKFEHVIVREPHSAVTLAELNNSCADMWCARRLELVMSLSNCDSIFFPDYGACERYSDVCTNFPTAFGKKKREFASGEIIDYQIIGKLGKKVLIVDDICSRGGTFVEASKQLKQVGIEEVNLLVSYCEENVFTGVLFDHINKLYTSTDWESLNHIQIIKID